MRGLLLLALLAVAFSLQDETLDQQLLDKNEKAYEDFSEQIKGLDEH